MLDALALDAPRDLPEVDGAPVADLGVDALSKVVVKVAERPGLFQLIATRTPHHVQQDQNLGRLLLGQVPEYPRCVVVAGL